MDRRTLTALKASIEHWAKNARRKAKNAEVGAEYCALCKLFNNQDTAKGFRCHGCPVREKTGAAFCFYTPYENAAIAWDAGDDAVWRAAAREELAFLKSLLPKPKRRNPA